MDAYIKGIKDYFEARIDFVGQEQTEKLARSTLWAFAGIAFVVGFLLQSLKVTLVIFSVGIVLTLVLILPAYPAYNSHPVKWLPTFDGPSEVKAGQEKEAKGKGKGKADSKKDR